MRRTERTSLTEQLTAIGSASIVIYDADHAAADRLLDYLQAKGYRVSHAADPQTVINLGRKTLTEAIIVFAASATNDTALCRALKEGVEPPGVVVIGDPSVAVQLKSALPEDARPEQLLTKPVPFPQILYHIENILLERRRRGAEEKALAPLHFAQLLGEMWKEERSGRLRVTAAGTETTIFLRDGVPVFAEEGSLGNTLGRILIDTGRITQKQFSHAVDRITERLVADEQLRLGEALIELGYLDAETIFAVLKEQTQRKIIACFGHDKFHSDFKDDAELVDDVGDFPTPVESLLLQGSPKKSIPKQ